MSPFKLTGFPVQIVATANQEETAMRSFSKTYSAFMVAITACTAVPAIAEQALPREACAAAALPQFTFSVTDEESRENFQAFYQADLADDGRANQDSGLYLEQLSHLPELAPSELPRMTFVVDRWFPDQYTMSGDATPAIRVFLRQEALVNPVGEVTSESDDGAAVVFLPMHGQATDPTTAAEQFVAHICDLRARTIGSTMSGSSAYGTTGSSASGPRGSPG
jgi:hypothetical protein